MKITAINFEEIKSKDDSLLSFSIQSFQKLPELFLEKPVLEPLVGSAFQRPDEKHLWTSFRIISRLDQKPAQIAQAFAFFTFVCIAKKFLSVRRLLKEENLL